MCVRACVRMCMCLIDFLIAKHVIFVFSGAIGAENLDEIDNAQVPFRPLTVKRVTIPRYVETGQ